MTAKGSGVELPSVSRYLRGSLPTDRKDALDSASCTLTANVAEFVYESSLDRPTLSSIDLEVRSGEFVVVVGPSGSGKSTLALVLAGVIPQRVSGAHFEGTVQLCRYGMEPINLSEVPLHQASQHVGVVFQNPEFQLIQYQVDAEVAFGPENLGLPRDEIVRRVHDSLSLAGVLEIASSPINGLSGGQKQRVAIAAALAMKPSMLVLDEPTSDLDPLGTRKVFEALQHLCHERGLGVIIVEHKLDEVAHYADRVILMSDGRVLIDDTPAKVFLPTSTLSSLGVRPPELAKLYEGSPVSIQREGLALSVDDAVKNYDRVTFRSSVCASVGEDSVSAIEDLKKSVQSGDEAVRQTAIELIDVTVRFKDKIALDQTSLKVAEGEWLALIGANGSGKSTAGAVVMGFTKPDTGSARIWGEKVVFGKIPLQARRLGYLFQNVDEMLFCETVREELEFSRKSGVEVPSDALSVEEIAEFIGLADRLEAHPYQLSGGERQRLGLGALLTRSPRGLILDEPTTGLDEEHATALFELLSFLRSSTRRISCVLITHDMTLVSRFADRVAVMKEGKVVVDGHPNKVFADTELLRSCGLYPPTIADLHRELVKGRLNEVFVTAEEFLANANWPIGDGGVNVTDD